MSALDAANWERYFPTDLIINPTTENLAANAASDKNNFTVVVPNLKIDSNYTFQFQYVFEDEIKSNWSPSYSVLTALISVLPKPKLTSANVTYFQGILNVIWDGADYNNTQYGNGFSRILVWIRDNSQASPLFRIAGELSKPGNFRLALPPKSHSVKLTAVSVNGEQSAYSDEFTFTPTITPPATPTGVTAAWSGTDFTVSFTHDASSSANEYLKEYLITLNTQSSGTKIFSLLPVSGSSQKFSLSLSQNQASFGTAVQAFSGNVQTLDIYGNKGTQATFSNTSYVSALTTPTITVSATTNGYTVSYPVQTSNTFQFISIEEVESNASTDPGTGYAGVATGSVNPIFVPAVNTNKRWVRARLYDTLNTATSYSTAIAVTPLSPVTVDNTGPGNVSSVTATGGIDTLGTLGFNGFINVSWPEVTGGGIRGYRIRFRPVSTPEASYAYLDSPGSGTSYRISGLTVGSTASPVVYEVSVATYDEYNNTSSSYVSATNVSISGTPAITDYITAGNFQFGQGVDSANATGTGTGTKRGLFFDSSNYWFLNSLNSARLKIGGSTTNYLLWDGSEFIIDGDLRARKGNFSGNVQIASGGSLYSGTLSGDSLSGAGFIVNNSGLAFNSSSINNITTINGSTGLLTTSSANIGGWLISPTTNAGSLYKTSGTNTVKLDSTAGAVTISGTGYTAGIGLPDASNIVFWAGGSRAETANFWVKQDGSVKLGSVTITGYATSGALDGKISTGGAASDVNNNATTISGGKIRSGLIQSNNWSGTVTNGSAPSANGMTIDLQTGAITSKKFHIDTEGNATYLGTLSANNINGGILSGSAINIGNGAFQVSTLGVLEATGGLFTGSIRSGSTITGADITMTGNKTGTGSLSTTTKLLFSASNYAITAGSSSFTYPGTSGGYNDDGDWIDSVADQVISNNDVRFTDSSYGGAVPYNTTYYYGELWLGSGNNSAGSVDLWANYPPVGTETGYIGMSFVANSSSKNIYLYGHSTAGFTTQHRSSVSDSSKESPAFLQVDSLGRMSRGRAIITGGSSSPSNTLGLKGDLYFSTAT